MRSTKNMTGKPSGAFNAKASGTGGPSRQNGGGKLQKVSAPAKPKMASMASAHGKLVKGDC